MCKCRFPDDLDRQAYELDDILLEEMTERDVIRATFSDFSRTIDKLKKRSGNRNYLRHLYDLMQFMHRDDCFRAMETDPDTYIETMLGTINLSVSDVLAAVLKAD